MMESFGSPIPSSKYVFFLMFHSSSFMMFAVSLILTEPHTDEEIEPLKNTTPKGRTSRRKEAAIDKSVRHRSRGREITRLEQLFLSGS